MKELPLGQEIKYLMHGFFELVASLGAIAIGIHYFNKAAQPDRKKPETH